MNIVFFAIIKLILIVVLGFFLYKKEYLKQQSLDFLASFVINFSIPFLIFSNIVDNFSPKEMPSVWIFLLLSLGLFLVGLGFSLIIMPTVPKGFKRETISLVSFHNCGYLPMNIALFLLPKEILNEFLVYIFIYLLGFNILMWSIGSYLIFKKKGEQFKINSLLTPPIYAVVLALIVVFAKWGKFIPDILLSPMRMIGDTSFVLSMIILGGWLAKSKIDKGLQNYFLVIKIIILKLVLIPFIGFCMLLRGDLPYLFGLFLIMQMSMPSAASLPIVTRFKEANTEFISQVVFMTHCLAIITVPFWIGMYLKLTGKG